MVETLGKVVLFLFIFLILVPLALLFFAFITGRIPRAYQVLDEAAQVRVAGRLLKGTELAERYAPIMKIRSSNPSPDILWVYYEIVDNQSRGTYDITYYNVWENEIHPNPVLHKVYSAFRAPYYGYPLYDIEYIQVSVGRQSGDICGVMYEDSPGDDYFVTFSEHLIVRYVRQEDGSWKQVVTDRQGTERSTTSNVPVAFAGAHPVLAASTWNHLSRLISPTDTSYDRVFHPGLRYLTEREYSGLKFVRKSQGEHKTREPFLSAFFGGLAGLALITVPGWLVAKAMSLKRKPS